MGICEIMCLRKDWICDFSAFVWGFQGEYVVESMEDALDGVRETV